MPDIQPLLKKLTLSSAEVLQIKKLAYRCETYEDLHISIPWSSLLSRPGDTINDFLYYVDGELVGYLSLNDIDPVVNEITGMVHPAYRRRGIFRQLLRAAQEECLARGEEQVLLTCEQSSRSGLAFIQTLPVEHMVSEYEMVLTNFRERQSFDERLTFHKAESSDLTTIIKIQSASFRTPEDATARRVLYHAQDPHRAYYLFTYGEEGTGCREPVGSMRLDHGEETIGIFAVGILPDYQGRSYGRQMLEEAIHAIRSYSQKPIFLFVNVENTRAIKLYHSCGFAIKTTYDYYLLNL
jgi:ribosomal protein S18 acetylase RimI-like enzyme